MHRKRRTIHEYESILVALPFGLVSICAAKAGRTVNTPVVVTSIPPRAIAAPHGEDAERVFSALRSFAANGYDIVSVRRQAEPEPCLGELSIRHFAGTDEGFFARRYGPSFRDIFRYARNGPVDAILNSDVFMVPCDAKNVMLTQERTIVAARRIDVDRLGGEFEGTYSQGIDGLFISPDIDLSQFETEHFAAFQLGAPFWDIVIPLVLSFHFNLAFATPPVLLHANHPQHWRQEDYKELRRHAVEITVCYAKRIRNESRRASQFLRGLEVYCPDIGNSLSDKQVKRAATYMAAFLGNIEAKNGADLNADLNHPFMRACVASAFGSERDHVNAARSLAHYYASDYGSLKIARYVARTLLRARRVAIRNRQVSDALLASTDADSVELSGKPRAVKRRPLIRVQLKHDLWTPDQYQARTIHLGHRPGYSSRSRGHDNRFAIVTPSFNQAQFLGATVDSVVSQAVAGLSYHVQDGGSCDGSTSVLEAVNAPITYVSKPDRGQAHAINLGFSAISGDVMGYLNSDDILLPGSLGYVSDFFDRNPDVDFLYSHRIFIDASGQETGRAFLPGHDPVALRWADYVPQETMFWRRRVWDRIGPFDESFQFAMDWDFILRALEHGFRFARVSRFLGAFRVHAQQKTSASMRIGEQEMAVLRERHLGFRPSQAEVDEAIRGYLNRQAVYSFLGRHRILRC